MIEANPRLRHTLAALLVLMVACGGGDASGPDTDSETPFSRGTLVIQTDGGRVTVQVEVADTLDERIQGLRGRESLAPDAGMVFLPDDPDFQTFVMEDTLIPLSVAWWDADGRVLDIKDMEPCPPDEDLCPSYFIKEMSAGAVEVNQGFFEDHGVEVGDRVTLQR